MVCEHDDNIKLKNSEDLTLEALNSPNVQVFILNDSTLMSFVELPILDSVAGVKTANSTVRLILRDISGINLKTNKFLNPIPTRQNTFCHCDDMSLLE